jgi:hypothetical protein
MILRISPTTLPRSFEETTFGSSDNTISASVPSSDRSLPRMISFDFTVSVNFS